MSNGPAEYGNLQVPDPLKVENSRFFCEHLLYHTVIWPWCVCVCVWARSVDWKLFKISLEQTAPAAKSHSRAGQKVVYGR